MKSKFWNLQQIYMKSERIKETLLLKTFFLNVNKFSHISMKSHPVSYIFRYTYTWSWEEDSMADQTPHWADQQHREKIKTTASLEAG